MEKGNAIIVDTNVLIHDPNSINVLREGGNTLFIPWAVIMELDGRKNSSDIGLDAREAIERIESLREKKEPTLKIYQKPSFSGLKLLDQTKPDHLIVATAKTVRKIFGGQFEKFKLVSKDRTVRLMARELLGSEIEVGSYYKDEIISPKSNFIQEIAVNDDLCKKSVKIPGDFGLKLNEGAVLKSETKGYCRAALYKGDDFFIIPPDIEALGVSPMSLNGNGPNWSQYIALAQLLDQKISLVFLQGGAGTGKTLLALAAAIAIRSSYKRIVVE